MQVVGRIGRNFGVCNRVEIESRPVATQREGGNLCTLQDIGGGIRGKSGRVETSSGGDRVDGSKYLGIK